MKVGELINHLEKFPKDKKVKIMAYNRMWDEELGHIVDVKYHKDMELEFTEFFEDCVVIY